uniref:OTU deubiquitinase with linear linkage specificity n=1 Tax=Homo sapiens TaxID=9606 RepID=A0A8V8TKZ0_HUMAN
MSRGTMPQPEAWPGASCAETPAREAAATARDGGKAAASGQPRPEMQCPAEQAMKRFLRSSPPYGESVVIITVH